MAPHVRETASIDSVVDKVDAVAGGLEADPETAALAPAWVALFTRGEEVAAALKHKRRAARRAGQRLVVVDQRWDSETAAFGRHVLDLADGKRDALPYTRFYRDQPPSAAQKLGPARAIETSSGWTVELDREPSSALTTEWKPRLQVVNDALTTTHTQRTEAVRAEAPALTAVRLYIDDLNHEIDRLEGDLLRIFAGRRHRVAAFFEPFRDERRANEPETPEAT